MAIAPNTVNTERALALAQAAIVAASFATLLAGTNAVNPLLPVYRDLLGLDPFLLSLTFVSYVGVLVVVLLVLSRPRFTRHAAPLLLAGIAVAIISDLLLANTQEWSILLGRAVAGIGGGMGTGSAAALVVAAIGAPGRALAATGNLVGAVLGTTASQLVVSLLAESSPQAVTLGHAALLGALLLAASVVLHLRRTQNRVALGTVSTSIATMRIDPSAVRMIATGVIGWFGVSVAIVFGATIFADLGQPVVRAVGPALMLGASAVAQLASPWFARVAPWMSGLVAMAVGAAGIVAGAMTGVDVLALIGFALLGAGIGVSYRAGLVALTRSSSPARQGALSSLYAAVTYAGAAVIVLAVGWIGNMTGIVVAALGAVAFAGVAALVALTWAPRLRDTADDGNTA
ncbi:MFS transporter [Microbacterium sp. CPCC 204701]|uniref:MFS transporter n=1 Tax=Microbacterium sp. CPCC 204701 TaxID=2493084 RepID=UPI000FDBE3DF|nr:MFS transporter [Microbacterium sp. CPCC 204701]